VSEHLRSFGDTLFSKAVKIKRRQLDAIDPIVVVRGDEAARDKEK
jgi:hypothetical protein